MDTLPPVPDTADPDPIVTEPLTPLRDTPEPKLTMPLPPKLELPVLSTSAPLTPDTPEFTVDINMLPLLDANPYPDNN